MQFQKRHFLRSGRRAMAFVVVPVLASLMLASAGPADAKRTLGTKGPDKIVGTAKADLIKARGGNDRVKGSAGNDRLSGGRGKDRLSGGRGKDRLSGGRGSDRLNAVDGRRDRVVSGGPGKDVCRIDAADRVKVKGCETVKVAKSRGPGSPVGPGSPGVPGGPLVCAAPPEGAKAAGDVPPTFSDAFYAITMTVNASADGLTGNELPISIEEVCDVPKSLESEAAQLVGGEGVALIGPGTKVFDATGQQLTGAAATTALAGADSLTLRVQLRRPAQWSQDEDGQPVPTFETRRADVTD